MRAHAQLLELLLVLKFSGEAREEYVRTGARCDVPARRSTR